ncbi:prolactin regulatory element-binding protein [Corythoichthys intestinalis]|uniref:prolactin regulatory element-binding protein n=1 Tax=Corythoichthys intestinalis TaxID=161448 RepID=UPI0025A638DF|nr:prolactin regulatory element-binding protein [Corythoichthys intestinalis]
MGKRRVPDLYRAPFPLYSIKIDPKAGLLVVAGGGGASNTGIKNGLHFLELQLVGENQYSASLVHSHDTATRATMNLALGHGVIAAGQDGTCSLMKFEDCAQKREGKPSNDVAMYKPMIFFFQFPSLKKKFDFKAHEGEIEDLDLSPGNKHLVTVGRDFACSVWRNNQQVMGLKWHETIQVAEKTYRYMACRFGKVEDQKDGLRLYTVQIPHKRERKPPPCYLTKWEGKSFLPMLTAPCGGEVISSLAVSDSGTFLGLGTITGSVAIYIAFSLQRLYYVKESHAIVVTDLAFLPDTFKGQSIKGNNETAMISVAVDSRCQLHAVHNRRTFPLWIVLFFCGLVVVGIVLLLQYFIPGFL